jgi:NAD(P)H-hydrate epimerase
MMAARPNAPREEHPMSEDESPPPFPSVRADELAWIDTAQMVEVDRVMIEDLGIVLLQMMENAGRNLATLVQLLMAPESAAVYTGAGGNAGGGMVAARHLANRGVDVTVVAARRRDQLGDVPRHQFDILERMGVPIVQEPVPADVAVDALIGYSLRGAPRDTTADLIGALEAAATPVISLDVPSGLDTTSGQTPGVAVTANATLTLAAPKRGLLHQPRVGRLFVGDISVPASVYRGMGVTEPAPAFGAGPIIEII